MKAQICFIGGGNMATSLIAGLIANDVSSDLITVVDHNTDKLMHLKTQYGVDTTTDLDQGVEHADVIVLAVKPQSMQQLAASISTTVRHTQPLLISIAAGIQVEQLTQWFGQKAAIVRSMPNTPAMFQCGAAGLYANDNVSQQQKEIAEHILRASSVVVWVDQEKLIDTIAATSGSGPAYVFEMMRHMMETAQQEGLTSQQAKLLVLQTFLGSAKMAIESSDDVETLRKNVTSKGGATAAALDVFEKQGFGDMVQHAMQANIARSESLAQTAKNGIEHHQTTQQGADQ